MNTTRNHTLGQGGLRLSLPYTIKTTLAAAGLLAAVLGSAPLRAADTYDASLKAGDEHRTKKEFEPALAEYEAAFGLAQNEGMKALALGKKGGVYLDQKKYTEAKGAAQDALAYQNLAPVAKVIALQVLGDCQLKDEKDYAAAIDTLEQGVLLEGVAWAQPSLNLSLGDSYRLSKNFDKALEAYQRVISQTSASEGAKSIAYINLGITYQYNLQDPDKAREAYKKAAELNPGLKGEVDDHLSRLQ